MKRILVVDDDPGIVRAISRTLLSEGYDPEGAANGEEALLLLSRSSYDAVLLDLDMPRLDGIGTIRRMKEEGMDVPVIVVSGRATVRTAVEAVRLGARDFIEKPPDPDRILVSLANLFDASRLADENARLRESSLPKGMVIESPAMVRLVKAAEKVAATDSRILITGETGTGKEVIARLIHDKSPRAARPFVGVNCAAVPGNLIESELFGHLKGAFTGADRARKGRFQQADTGTLFLDEIGEMPKEAQAKVLRSIETGEIEPLGAEKSVKVDCRIVAATNRDLAEEVKEGRFREDLFFRIAVHPIHIPPLRERREEIIPLFEYFAGEISRRWGRTPPGLSEGAREVLLSYHWPGNVREMGNIAERILLLAEGDEIGPEEIESLLTFPGAGRSGRGGLLKDRLDETEREAILEAIENAGKNMTRAAGILGIERSLLYKKMKRLGMKG